MSTTNIEHAASEKQAPRRDWGPIIRDVIIGFADGLTVPFALTAGLSSLGSSRLVIVAGLAELVSGAISMGLGAFLAAVTEREQYISEERIISIKVTNEPDQAKTDIYNMLGEYNITEKHCESLMASLEQNVDCWIKFILDIKLKLEKPASSRAVISALTMGMSYFLGGLIPMIPYFVVKNIQHALFVSIGLTVFILLIFGWVKTILVVPSKRSAMFGALQTLLIGMLAAGASYGIVRAIEGNSHVA